MTGRTIDLNADAGEDPRALADGRERALLERVSAVNIATGAHAGDDDTMRAACDIAREFDIAVGAHPAYPDRPGFGRTSMAMSDEGLRTLIRKQVEGLRAIAADAGVAVTRVKPHGALYHDASSDERTVRALLDAVDTDLALVLPPTAATLRLALDADRRVLLEGFADRAYCDDGTLVPRDRPGAVITDHRAAAEQCLRLLEEGVAGRHLDTLCIHADTPQAPRLARAVADALHAGGVLVKAPERTA